MGQNKKMRNRQEEGHPEGAANVGRGGGGFRGLLGGRMAGRREFFRIAGTGVVGAFLVPSLRQQVLGGRGPDRVPPQIVNRARNCVFVHLQGAASHVDTFDLKVGPWTPDDFGPETIGGIHFPAGLLPNLAEQIDRMAIVRSVRAPALVHSLQQVWSQISRNPTSAVGKVSPNLGAVVARELEPERLPNQKLPGFVSLNGGTTVGAGYFSSKYTPFSIIANANGLNNLSNNAGQTAFEERYQMLMELDHSLRANSPLGEPVLDVDGFYQQGREIMYNPAIDAIFRFTGEEATRYGSSGFGNSCLVARNLLQANQGTRYIQLNLGGWDNHTNIYATGAGIYGPSRQLDRGLSALLNDLAQMPGQQQGSLLDETLIVVMGEFGRTVRSGTTVGLNSSGGRDHYFQHFAVFYGGGVTGRQVIGQTTDDGFAVVDPGWSHARPIANEDIAATIYSALGIDYTQTLWDDPLGRGFDLVPFASEGAWYPITELFSRQLPQRPRPGSEVDRRSSRSIDVGRQN
jgi:PAS domain-containing protein